MDYTELYYKQGCTKCSGKVIFIEDTFTYKCTSCGAFANAHRKDTEFSRKYEPYQYMADGETNELRKALENVFGALWNTRVPYMRENSKQPAEECLINIIFPENIRIFEKDLEKLFVKTIKKDKKNYTSDIYIFDSKEIIEGVPTGSLGTIPNRSKAHVWLAEQLGIAPSGCKIGYLSEANLKEAIGICHKNISDARRKAVESCKGRT